MPISSSSTTSPIRIDSTTAHFITTSAASSPLTSETVAHLTTEQTNTTVSASSTKKPRLPGSGNNTTSTRATSQPSTLKTLKTESKNITELPPTALIEYTNPRSIKNESVPVIVITPQTFTDEEVLLMGYLMATTWLIFAGVITGHCICGTEEKRRYLKTKLCDKKKLRESPPPSPPQPERNRQIYSIGSQESLNRRWDTVSLNESESEL